MASKDVTVTVRLSQEDFKKLESYAKDNGLFKSQACRNIIINFLKGVK